MMFLYESVATVRAQPTVIAAIATPTASALATQLGVVSVLTYLR